MQQARYTEANNLKKNSLRLFIRPFAGNCLIIVAVAFMSVSALAQTTGKDTLIQRDLILEKEYEPEVEQSEKIVLLPELETPTLQKRASEFSLSGNPATLNGIYLPLSAPSITTAFPAQQQLGYFSFAGGSKLTFTGDGQLNLIRKSRHTLDIRMLHRSVFGDITNSMGVANRSYMNQNRLMANYVLHLPGNELKVSLGQRYNAWNYYGTWKTPLTPNNTNELTTPDAQWLSDSEFSLEFKSKKPEQPFTYSLGAGGHLFFLGKGISDPGTTVSTKGGRESELILKGSLEYDLSEKLQLGVDADLEQFSYREPDTYPAYQEYHDNQASTVDFFAEQSWLQVNPYAHLTIRQWELVAGLKVAVPTLESERVKWSPLLSGSTSLSDKAAFRVSLNGGIIHYSYREGFDLNPYLDPFIHLKTAYQPVHITAGIDFKPFKALRISPKLEYDRVNDMPLFYNALPGTTDKINDAYGSLFSVKYMNSNRFTLGTEAYYNFRSKLRFFTEVRYNHYVNYSEDAAFDLLLNSNRRGWYKPAFEARFRLDFSPMDKITTFVDYQISALRYAPTYTEFMHRMDDIHDLNVGISWEMARNVQLFFRLNNLLDQRYEIWNAYQVHGFSAMIGGYVRF